MAHGGAGRRCLFSCSGTLRSVGASLRLWAAMLRAPLFLKMKHGKLQARKVSLAASMTTFIQGRKAKVRRRAPPPWARPGQQSAARPRQAEQPKKSAKASEPRDNAGHNGARRNLQQVLVFLLWHGRSFGMPCGREAHHPGASYSSDATHASPQRQQRQTPGTHNLSTIHANVSPRHARKCAGGTCNR